MRQKVGLTADERLMPDRALAKRFGLHPATAGDAKKRGYFVINPDLRHRYTIPEDRTVPPELLLPVVASLAIAFTSNFPTVSKGPVYFFEPGVGLLPSNV